MINEDRQGEERDRWGREREKGREEEKGLRKNFKYMV